MTKLSVYIPCYNAATTIVPVLQALARQTHPADEVLIVDDGSTDDTASVAQGSNKRWLRLLKQPSNLGLGAARNLALAHASGDILVGLDADVCPEPDYLHHVVQAFHRDPELVGLCGRLQEAHTEKAVDRWRARHMGQHWGDQALYNPRFLFGATTAVRATCARHIGGWDARFRASYEDVDFSQRLRSVGLLLRYEPQCRAQHLKQDSLCSLLTAFWRWHHPAGLINRQYATIDTWLDRRLKQTNWRLFTQRFERDQDQPEDSFLAITALMPWWMTRLDLEHLAVSADGDNGIADAINFQLPQLAESALSARSVPQFIINWICGELRASMTPVGQAGGSRLIQAREALMEAATEHLPQSGDLWQRVARGIPMVAGQLW